MDPRRSLELLEHDFEVGVATPWATHRADALLSNLDEPLRIDR